MAAEVNDDGGMAQKRVSETAQRLHCAKFLFFRSSHLTTTRVDTRPPSHPLQLSVPTAIRPRYASPDELDQVLLTRSPLYAKTESPTLRYTAESP